MLADLDDFQGVGAAGAAEGLADGEHDEVAVLRDADWLTPARARLMGAGLLVALLATIGIYLATIRDGLAINASFGHVTDGSAVTPRASSRTLPVRRLGKGSCRVGQLGLREGEDDLAHHATVHHGQPEEEFEEFALLVAPGGLPAPAP